MTPHQIAQDRHCGRRHRPRPQTTAQIGRGEECMCKRVMIISGVSLFLLVMTLLGQSGSLRGVVSDQTGAVIPGVAITVRHVAFGTEWRTLSDDRGVFVIPAI